MYLRTLRVFTGVSSDVKKGNKKNTKQPGDDLFRERLQKKNNNDYNKIKLKHKCAVVAQGTYNIIK